MSRQVEVGDVGRGRTLDEAKRALLKEDRSAEALKKAAASARQVGVVDLTAGVQAIKKAVKRVAKEHPNATSVAFGDELFFFDRD